MKQFIWLCCFCIASCLYGTDAAAADLIGSDASLERENQEARRSKLSFIEDDVQLENMIRDGLLVPIPVNTCVAVSPTLETKWHYVRPWVSRFLVSFGCRYHQKFGIPIVVNSAVRTVARQIEIKMKGNGNAAPPYGPRRSVHPTGAAIDIASLKLPTAHTDWMDTELLQMEEDGRLEATAEGKAQTVYHVMIFKAFDVAPPKPPKSARN